MCCFSSRTKVTEYPHCDNNYYVDLTDPSDPAWVSPYRSYDNLKPYRPKAGLSHFNIIFDRSASVFCSDFFRMYCAILEPKDLCSFSEVSKCCYLAAKADLIWEMQMKKLLSNVRCLPKAKCLFPPRQQFQIIYKAIRDRKKPFTVQFQHNFEKIEEFESSLAKLETFLSFLNLSKEHRTYTSSNEYIYLKNLVGNHYDGSIRSIDPMSQQGRCLAAFRFIDQEFNDPKKFKDTLLSSECGCGLF